MDDKVQNKNMNGSSHSTRAADRVAEPVRSRWTPKPEQILILESIFNSGMVNPPKDETVRIRKIIEKFGAVGDANVFYWFQNRRSRSRRRQRQLQVGLMAEAGAVMAGARSGQFDAIIYEPEGRIVGRRLGLPARHASHFIAPTRLSPP